MKAKKQYYNTSLNEKLLLLKNKRFSSEQQNDKIYNYGTYNNKCLSSGHLSSGLGTGVEIGHQSNESLASVVQNPGIVVISVT